MTCVFHGWSSFSFRNRHRRHLRIVAILNRCTRYRNSDVCRLRSPALDGRGSNILIGRNKLKYMYNILFVIVVYLIPTTAETETRRH